MFYITFTADNRLVARGLEPNGRIVFANSTRPRPNSHAVKRCDPRCSIQTNAAVCSHLAPTYSKCGKHQRLCRETKRNYFARSLKKLSSQSTKNIVARISLCERLCGSF